MNANDHPPDDEQRKTTCRCVSATTTTTKTIGMSIWSTPSTMRDFNVRALSAGRKSPCRSSRRAKEPSADDWQTMTALGISYGGGIYRLGEYRYDRLADALAYAN